MNNIIIFDLDDTLFKEIEYLQSGFSKVASHVATNSRISEERIYSFLTNSYKNLKKPFNDLISYYNLKIELNELIKIYRNHKPSIKLSDETIKVLNQIKIHGDHICILTDGRSIQQRNKINALDLEKYIDRLIISEEFGSEKPSMDNFLYFQEYFSNNEFLFFYIGDNLMKDFYAPNKLGWSTICLIDDGHNIHKQNFQVEKEFLPKHSVKKIHDILEIVYEK